MSKPVLSLFGSAVRPWLWTRFCASLASNEVPFEVIFVGDRLPLCKLPPFAHFVYSETKPAQCFEIAARYTTGDHLMNFTDDVVLSPGALDRLLAHHDRRTSHRQVSSGRFLWGDMAFNDEHYRFLSGNLESPPVPVMGLMDRPLWEELGGIDARFLALNWDLDLAMRTYELGGSISFCDEVTIQEVFSSGEPDEGSLFPTVGLPMDRPLLESLWIEEVEPHAWHPDRHYCLKDATHALRRRRRTGVEPFRAEQLLTRSQGPKGRWP